MARHVLLYGLLGGALVGRIHARVLRHIEALFEGGARPVRRLARRETGKQEWR